MHTYSTWTILCNNYYIHAATSKLNEVISLFESFPKFSLSIKLCHCQLCNIKIQVTRVCIATNLKQWACRQMQIIQYICACSPAFVYMDCCDYGVYELKNQKNRRDVHQLIKLLWIKYMYVHHGAFVCCLALIWLFAYRNILDRP